MADRNILLIKGAEEILSYVLPDEKDTSGIMVKVGWVRDVLALLKEQDNCENCAIAIEDRQPVVRCKNCKHGKINICDEFTTCYNVDSCLYGNKRKSNWWCADGELKE